MGALGAEPIVDLHWEPDVLARTQQRGVDAFVDVLGGNELQRAVRVTRMAGTIALVGFAAVVAASVALPSIITRALKLRAISVGSRESFIALDRVLENARIHPLIDSVYPFSRARGVRARCERTAIWKGRHRGGADIASQVAVPWRVRQVPARTGNLYNLCLTPSRGSFELHGDPAS